MKPEISIAVVVSVVLAVATSLWTWWPHQAETVATADKTGQLLTLNGKKVAPEDVTALSVATWDAESKEMKVFSVERKENVWVIPSKFNYPADGGARVGKTAGGVLNVPRGPLVTNDPKNHADLGVVDPAKEGTSDAEGRGKKVTLKDAGGAVVVDLIVGKHAENADVSYVRESASDEVYTAKVDVEISTGFKEWVETDLLKIVSGDIRTLGIEDYSIDEEKGVIKERASTEFKRPKDKNEWTSAETPAEKVVNQDTIGRLLGELTGLRLIDVVQFSPDQLKDNGFFPSQEGTPLGKEGTMSVGTKDGLRYHLFFGNIAVTEEDKAGKTKAKADPSDSAKPKNRYMAVFLGYDAELDESKPGKAPAAIAKPDEEKESAGQKRANRAQKRFIKFFYVISDETFKKFRPEKDTLFKSKDSKDSLPGDKVPKELNLEKTSSGLQYVDLKKGDGAEAAEGDDVEVHYTGWLEKDGTKFDSSVDRNTPFPFTIGKGQVIKGWDEGVKGMKVGGKRKLVIPAELGYGPNGSGQKIPGGATLVFDVELLKAPAKEGAKKEEPKAPALEEKKTEEPKKIEEPKKPEETKKTEEPAKTEAPAKPEEKKPEETKKSEAPAKTDAPAKPEEKKPEETKKSEEPAKTEAPAKPEEKKSEDAKKSAAPVEDRVKNAE